jgi:hypothetical protein
MKKTLLLLTAIAALAAFGPHASGQITNVNVGTTANDGTGDPLRIAFLKLNSNITFIAGTYVPTNYTGVQLNSNTASVFGGKFFGNGSGLTGLAVSGLSGLTPGQIAVGNILSNAVAVALSGDATMNSNGVLSLANTSGARSDLGLGSAAVLASSAVAQTANNLSDLANAATAVANLGAVSIAASNTVTGGKSFTGGIRLGNIYAANGVGSGVNIFFDPTTNMAADQALTLYASPWTSGASLAFPLKMTNVMGSPDVNGYYDWDHFGAQPVTTGLQATNADLPGCGQYIANFGIPIVIDHATGIGNFPSLYCVADTTNGEIVEIPYYDGVNGHQTPLPLRYDNTTNIYFRAASAPKLFEIIQNTGDINFYNPSGGTGVFRLANGMQLYTTNGQIIKANGQFNNAAFDVADVGVVHHDAATVDGNIFKSAGTATSFAGGPCAFLAFGDGSGMMENQSAFILEIGTGASPQMAFAKAGSSGNGNACVAVGGAELETIANWQNAIFEVNGSTADVINGYTSSPSVSITNSTVLLTATGLTATLPDATSHARGRRYAIKLKATGSGTVATTSSQTIDGSTTYSLSAANKFVVVESDGTNWNILGNN